MQNTSNTFFTSDTHFGHKNIVRGISQWEDVGKDRQTRDFDTLEEHNYALVKSINAVVGANDVLYHLGDWSFGGHENIKIFRDQLNCQNIHLIFGNHDQHIEPINSPYRKLFASCDYYKEISLKIDSTKTGLYGKTRICMSHYAARVWNKSHHGSILLFGHSHGTLKDKFYNQFKTMDVGVDTHDLYPYHLDEIINIMKGRAILKGIDHHNEKLAQ